MQYSLVHKPTRLIMPVQKTSQGIRCSGAYSGYCDYSITGETLSIHTISVVPQGSRLGAALLMIAALEGSQQGATKMEALSTATEAIGFYLKSGFLPNNPLNNGKSSYNLSDPNERNSFAMRILARYYSATWEGKSAAILRAVDEQMKNLWEIDFAP